MSKDVRSLLIVDDDAGDRETLGLLFQQEGYVVSLSRDGREALEVLHQLRFDLVLLDVTMPGLNGLEVLKAIRASHSATDLPVIMVTGRDHRDDVVAALQLGANDYVTKPFDFPVALARVGMHIALKRSVDQMRVLDEKLAQKNRDLETANRKLTTAYQKMRQDLEAAARIQRAFLPQALPELPGMQFAWKFHPCEHLAGDTLNIVPLDPEHIGLYVLDVSGHGVAAALLSVTLSRLLAPEPAASSILLQSNNGQPGYQPTPPGAMIEALARRFPWDSNTEQFFTILYGILNTRTGELRYASAGHPGWIHLSRNRPPAVAKVSSFPIGFPDLKEDHRYQEDSLQLRAGDRLFLYTDGLTEARNAAEEQFSLPRLLKILDETRGAALEESLTSVVEGARQWCGGVEFQDDISVLAVEYTRSPSTLRHNVPAKTAAPVG